MLLLKTIIGAMYLVLALFVCVAGYASGLHVIHVGAERGRARAGGVYMQEKKWKRVDPSKKGEQQTIRSASSGGGGGGYSSLGGRSTMSRSRRNDPWWMREEEKNNPRVLPAYKPWWAGGAVVTDPTATVAMLREEMARRDLAAPAKATKADLLTLLHVSDVQHDLSDGNFMYVHMTHYIILASLSLLLASSLPLC